LYFGNFKSKPGEVKNAVEAAISAGYRHIDCSPMYENENEVGEAIAAKIKDGTVSRDQLYVVSKVSKLE
jgi:diketogulonate reductase-like aldo/keto reductase